MDDKVVQLQLATKGSKISGAASLVRKEVSAVIARDKPSELLSDIALLKTSIGFRTDEQKQFKAGSVEFAKHQARIAMEEAQRKKLQAAYDKNKKKRDKAKAKAKPPAAAAAAPASAAAAAAAPASASAAGGSAAADADGDDEGWTEVKSKK